MYHDSSFRHLFYLDPKSHPISLNPRQSYKVLSTWVTFDRKNNLVIMHHEIELREW